MTLPLGHPYLNTSKRSGLFRIKGNEDDGKVWNKTGRLSRRYLRRRQDPCHFKHDGHAGPVVIEPGRVGDRVPVSTDDDGPVRHLVPVLAR